MLYLVNYAVNHIFLADFPSNCPHLRPICSCPNLENSSLVQAHEVAVDFKASQFASEFIVAMQGLVVDVKRGGKGDCSKITESNGDAFGVDLCSVSGRAKIVVIIFFEKESCDPTRVILSSDIEIFEVFDIFLFPTLHAMQLDVLLVIAPIPPKFHQVGSGVHEFPVRLLELIALGPPGH
jgi:hypothetical protein